MFEERFYFVLCLGPPGDFLFLAVRSSTPCSVTSIVCSNWALSLPSLVVAVQSSGQLISCQVPSLIIGSIVKIIPGFMTPEVLLPA